jgi:hypothetical protein
MAGNRYNNDTRWGGRTGCKGEWTGGLNLVEAILGHRQIFVAAQRDRNWLASFQRDIQVVGVTQLV